MIGRTTRQFEIGLGIFDHLLSLLVRRIKVVYMNDLYSDIATP